MADVKTTIVVQFSQQNAGGGSQLTAEIDSREEGLNAGKTSFAPGDSASFLIFKTPNVTIDSVQASAGGLTPLGNGLYAVDEFLNFADEAEASLSKPYYSGAAFTWYGANLGTITFLDGRARIATPGVGVARVTYNAQYTAYSLNSPPTLAGSNNFPILVVVKGHDDA